MKKPDQIALVELDYLNEENFVFIDNLQLCNITVVGTQETFEMDIVWGTDICHYYPEYHSDFLEVADQIENVVFNALDYLLENSTARLYDKKIGKRADIKTYTEDFIVIDFLHSNPEVIYYTNGKKGKSLQIKIGDYLKFRDYRKLQLLVPNKEENKTKSKGKI